MVFHKNVQINSYELIQTNFYATCKRSEQNEDSNSKWEQEQEDLWMESLRPMVSL